MTDSVQIHAAFGWIDGALQRDVVVTIDADGRIGSVRHGIQASASGVSIQLQHHLLLPGFVNAHSHAFQRALRRRPQRFGEGRGSFWTWRDAMYDLVDELTEESCYEISYAAFREMLSAGITTVGEFHYVHHAPHASWALDDTVLRAAADAGIRIKLLMTCYLTGSIGQPLTGPQKRFDAFDLETFLQQAASLRKSTTLPTQSIGLAAHSIRAMSIEQIEQVADFAAREGIHWHMHVEEQRQEIELCRRAYGTNPLRLLLDQGLISERFTAIHCTHSTPEDLESLFQSQGHICLCPLTEGNLADGFPAMEVMSQAAPALCIGTDCNLRISMLEELRMLEFGQRLRAEASGQIVDEQGRCAEALLRLATLGGAASLGLPCGQLAPGAWGDVVAMDLNAIEWCNWSEPGMIDNLVFSAGHRSISHVWVGGRQVDHASAAR